MPQIDRSREDNREVAYVLFLDIVNFSSTTSDEQFDSITLLNEWVTSLKTARTPGVAEEALIFLPTGDGMAIVFIGQPSLSIEPLEWALKLDIWRQDYNATIPSDGPELDIRMGLHTGTIIRVRDAYGRPNVAGGGINRAQRIMDLAAGGGIVSSEEYRAFVLDKYRIYTDLFQPTRSVTVKHNEPMHVCNVTGLWNQRTVGRTTAVELRPRAEMLPRELARSILVFRQIVDARLESTPSGEQKSGLSRLAYASLNSHLDRLVALARGYPMSDATEKWKTVNTWLDALNDSEYAYLELMSLIAPDLWKNGQWKSYQRRIWQISREKKGIARRLHVVTESDVCSCIVELVSLMLAEFLCSLRARLFEVNVSDVEALQSAPEKWAYRSTGAFSLFDGGSYYGNGGKYLVIMSNIKPYFLLNVSARKSDALEFSVYEFGTAGMQFVYEEVRSNFRRAWHNRDHIVALPTLLKRIGPDGDFEDICGKVAEFLPTGLARQDGWKEKLITAIQETIGQDFEGHERDSEDYLWEKCSKIFKAEVAVVANMA